MQMGLAVQSYESSHEVLPPGVVNETGPVLDQPKGYGFGWMTQILPYFEMKNVYNHFNLKVGLYEAREPDDADEPGPQLPCPSDNGPTRDKNRIAMTSYVGVHHDVEAPIAADNHGVLFLNSHVRYEDVTDGTSSTLFVGEKLNDGLDLGWASGTRASLRNTGSAVNCSRPGTVPSDPRRPRLRPRERHLAITMRRSKQSRVRRRLCQPASRRVQLRLWRRLGPVHQDSIGIAVYQHLANRADGEVIDADQYLTMIGLHTDRCHAVDKVLP